MGTFASNVIGSHRAPPDATLLHFFSKYLFRTLFFRTRSQKGTFKAFPTKWYTFSLFQSCAYACACACAYACATHWAPSHCLGCSSWPRLHTAASPPWPCRRCARHRIALSVRARARAPRHYTGRCTALRNREIQGVHSGGEMGYQGANIWPIFANEGWC